MDARPAGEAVQRRVSSERGASAPAAAGPARPYAARVFFLFGFGTKQRELGPGAVRTCPNCGNTTAWARVRESRQFTVFFLPIARWGRRDLEVCTVCSTAVEV